METPAEEAYSYSLFSELVLLDIRFDKKTIDATGKNVFLHYLKNINPRCLIILRASTVPAKQMQWLATDEQVALVQIVSLTEAALQQWIRAQLQTRKIKHSPEIPELFTNTLKTLC